jgi:hypothetical protein
MAASKRPTVILVFAILNIVFSSIGLLASLCCVGPMTVGLLFIGNITPPAGASQNEVQAFTKLQPFLGEIAGFMGVSLVVGLVLATMLLASGIGLLGMKPWARWLSVIWAVASIFTNIGTQAYSIGVLQPRMEAFQKDMIKISGKGAANRTRLLATTRWATRSPASSGRSWGRSTPSPCWSSCSCRTCRRRSRRHPGVVSAAGDWNATTTRMRTRDSRSLSGRRAGP